MSGSFKKKWAGGEDVPTKYFFLASRPRGRSRASAPSSKRLRRSTTGTKAFFLNEGNQVYWQISYQYLVPQSKYGSLPSIAKRSEYTTLVRAGMI
jgi:hypothetical protein